MRGRELRFPHSIDYIKWAFEREGELQSQQLKLASVEREMKRLRAEKKLIEESLNSNGLADPLSSYFLLVLYYSLAVGSIAGICSALDGYIGGTRSRK